MVINNVKFKQILKEKNLNKTKLSDQLQISTKTIAKIGKGENISENIVNKIAEFLEIDKAEFTKNFSLLQILRQEKEFGIKGSIYHELQVRLTYNSNHIEGSKLTEDQTRYIFETQTVGEIATDAKVDDIIETTNHFKCVDYCLENAHLPLTENFIKTLQLLLKQGTMFVQKYGAGKFKDFANTVGGNFTTPPEKVEKEISTLLKKYNSIKKITLEDIVDFHYKFECIHPFQDGNGRVGRLIMLKECLKNNIIPILIDDKFKRQYYNGFREYKNEKAFLIETCKFGQDIFKKLLDYFKIEY